MAGQGFKTGGYQLKRILFVPSRNADAQSIDPSELGLIPLNDPIERPPANGMGPGKTAGAAMRSKARTELFALEDIPMKWSRMRRVGAGLANLGNTCFMNSVLQCLLHTPPLAELLLSNRQLAPPSHISSTNTFDPIAITRQLLHDSLGNRRDYVSPQLHARTLKRVNRSFRLGRQEDAHEYLIALLDAMHERSIAGINPKPPPDVEFTSFVYRIFGGRIRSQVKCTQCGYESNTYDPFLDLSLEITHARSVERALQRFTEKEILDGGNKYKCPKQNRPVRAIKRMTLEDAPNILVIQLKRFEFSFSGRKISKPVEFRDTLDISPYLSRRPAVPAMYELYGVLVHQGHSMHSGHYFCFLKGSGGGGEWHKFDDTRVHPTSARNVLGQQPYLLFYMRRQPAGLPSAPQVPVPAPMRAPEAPPLTGDADKVSSKAAQRPASAEAASGGIKRKLVADADADADAVDTGKASLRLGNSDSTKDKGRSMRENGCPSRRGVVSNDLPLPGSAPDGLDDAQMNGEISTSSDEEPSRRLAQRVRRVPSRFDDDYDMDGSDDSEPSPVMRYHNIRSRRAGLTHSPVVTATRRGMRLAEQQRLLLSAVIAARAGPAAFSPQKRRKLMANGHAADNGLSSSLEERPRVFSRRRKLQPIAESADAAGTRNQNVDDKPTANTQRQEDHTAGVASNVGQRMKKGVQRTDTLAAHNGEDVRDTRMQEEDVAPQDGRIGRASVKQFLRPAANGLGVDAWDEVDIGEKRRHDSILRRSAPVGRQLDEYDREYDRGKIKKVRKKDGAGDGLDARAFDAAVKAQMSGKKPAVQLKGKKKKRAADVGQRRRRD